MLALCDTEDSRWFDCNIFVKLDAYRRLLGLLLMIYIVHSAVICVKALLKLVELQTGKEPNRDWG